MNMCLHRCRLFNPDTSNEPVHSLSRTTYWDFPPRGEEDTLKSKRWGREIPQELEEFVKKWLTF